MMALLGQKGNMVQLYDERALSSRDRGEGRRVLRGRQAYLDRHGYEALQIGFGAASTRNPRAAERFLQEGWRAAGPDTPRNQVDKVSDYQVGQKLGVGVFATGDRVHVTGVTRGRGFAGGVRRWGWSGGPSTHGSMTHRRIGSLGSGTTPGRPLKGRTQAGHYGAESVTVRNLPIVKLEPERGVLYVGGAIPGHRGGLVLIRKKA